VIDLIEYQSREYCKDIKCFLLKDVENYGSKTTCNGCEAYQFHKWLQGHDYKIVKSKILKEHQEMDKEFEGIAEMIEFRSENLNKDSLNELLDDIKDIADNNYGKWREE